ncbi:coiled-coil domain-containing protein [Histomonas meleagridis]|uniref:coiled-coil domain-containing protein 94-like n=1 Tax=Histomonas meleagridis TaxID=135588 RepID=UPI00355A5ED4|nr:coiled-coil domain-containing protein [Histomonas meleagridis]KAH0798158.1 coiled-coil domain-containing protein 94-like [Histomonas meleagridis]
MGERRVQSSYIPSDFDPSKVGRRSKPQHGQHDVRFMLPMSIQCKNCGDYMFQGTKANARKELCYDEFYLDIPVYRIYFHCKNCYSEITIKTDPKNCDYIVEQGASRHFEPWRKVQLENAEEAKMKIQKSTIEVLESNFKVKNREILQAQEIERLSLQAHKRKKVKPKDLIKIHEAEAKTKNLTDSDIKLIEEFEEKPTNNVNKKEKVKTFFKFGAGHFAKNSNFGVIDD